MDFKTILTVTGIGRETGDLALAAALCEENRAHLSVLAVAFAAPPPVGKYAAMVSDVWMKEREADAARLKDRLTAISALLADREVSADIGDEYEELTWIDEVIGQRARFADLVFAGPELMATETLKEKVVEGVLFFSATPLLVVPPGFTPSLAPKRVMIGWDGRIEAACAVQAARPLLARAEEVRLVLVDPVADAHRQGIEPGSDVAAYLARHGARVVIDKLPSEGRTVAEVLRRHAVDSAADLMVMGGYGHSRLRERIFGGVTRSILETPPIPVLMAR